MNSKEKEIIQKESTSLGDCDIHAYLPKARIMEYSDLSKYKDIHQLIKNPKDYFILLYEDANINGCASGHWACVFIDKNHNINFFESYGSAPDTQLEWVNQTQLKLLGVCDTYLTNLFNKAPEKIIYSSIKYQNDSKSMATCGRHVLNVLLNVINNNMTLDDYYIYMKNLKNRYNKNYDYIVTNLINI